VEQLTVLVTGAGGLLGRETARALDEAGAVVSPRDRAVLDVTERDEVLSMIDAVGPDVVVHCAAMTDVDACENDPDRAFAVNAEGSRNVAEAAERAGAAVVAVSTDYVFDGRSGGYAEDDEPNPIQVYGRSKLAGEEAVREVCSRHFVLRSAWIYGEGGKNFLSRLPGFVRDGVDIKAVADQRGSPTYAPDLAGAVVRLSETQAYGTYHVVNGGACTFAEFCRFALEALGASIGMEEVSVSELGRPAPRPHDTSLVSRAWEEAGFDALRSWRDAATAFAEVARTSIT
jgi:dTDP-4-dehydrorhamnose reductase